jgi:hypothetical protein
MTMWKRHHQNPRTLDYGINKNWAWSTCLRKLFKYVFIFNVFEKFSMSNNEQATYPFMYKLKNNSNYWNSMQQQGKTKTEIHF